MLSVSRIKGASRAAAYYGGDDYYVTGEADAPGLAWGGKGAERLALRATARGGDLEAVLGGANPDPQGPAISSAERGKGHHPGWDFTFSAPKSVSVAILVGGDKRLDAAHDRAVQKAMDYAERHLSFTRTREAGLRRDQLTGNLLYAKTVHGVSREGDPQRHTHVVIANATYHQASGIWRALESRHLYRRRMLLGKIYQSELAREAMALGYDVRRGRGEGVFELAAWSRAQLKVFAKRTDAIQQALEAEKPATAAARDAVKLKNRPDKIDRPRAELLDRWRVEAKAAGLDIGRVVAEAAARPRGRDRTPLTAGRVSETLSQLRALIGRALGARAGRDPYATAVGAADRDIEARAAVSLALRVQDVRSAVFTRHDVIEHALDLARAGVGVERLARDLARLEQSRQVISAERYLPAGITTSNALGIEAGILNRIEAGRGRGAVMIAHDEVGQRIGAAEKAERLTLNAGQRQAAATFLASDDRYVAVQGSAGVGKTTMLKVVGSLASGAGFEITAITPTHRAATAMKEEAGIHATTVAAWLATVERAMETPAGRRNVQEHWRVRALVVDEASMVSNAQMAEIAGAADRIGIRKVVFMGDERQLGSPEAGAPFRLALGSGIAQARMRTILRQQDPTLRDSVRELAEGRAHAGLQLIESHIQEQGRGTGDAALAAAAVAVWKDGVAGGDAPRIIVPTNALRSVVSDFIRQERIDAGELAPAGVERERYQHARLTGPERHAARAYRIGQRLVFHAAQPSAGLRRGAEADVVGVDRRNDVLRVATAIGDMSIDLRDLARHARMPFDAYWPKAMEVAAGEQLVWERADPKRRYLTGAGFTVIAMDESHWTIRHEDGREEKLRADDPALRFIGYGYAETADRAQGQTYRSVVAILSSKHGDAVSAARQYVMQSRPSHAFRLITDERRLLVMRLGAHDGLNRIALENLDLALGRETEAGRREDHSPTDEKSSDIEPGGGAAKDVGRDL